MAENTKIEWATHTFNPWIGCTKVSPACDHCYAEELMDRRYRRVQWGSGNPRLRTSDGNWRKPILWNKRAANSETPVTVFCASLADVFDNEVSHLWRADLMTLIEATPNLIWLLLTKRIGNVLRMAHRLPPNVAIGATMVTQDEYDRDSPKLAEVKARLSPVFTFGSFEPLLGPITLDENAPDWVIVGGESGRGARPLHPEWARSLRDQCAEADVAFFFKQWGEWAPHTREIENSDGSIRTTPKGGVNWHSFDSGISGVFRVGKKAAGAMLDGKEYREVPVALVGRVSG